MRKNILEKGIRIDGRKLDEIRPISTEVGVLPRTHGTGLFQRGETQVLTVTTLGSPGAAMIIDTMDIDVQKRYMHFYNFPPYATGEVKMMRGTSRREIGHGFLAERALVPVLPSKEDFPYTMLLVSETLTCNGSSSMASVCGSTLSLMDAGVPIRKPVAGIAMVLVTSDEFKQTGKGTYKILSDIQGLEDFAGDMDFKVTGTDTGITALQMDMKVKGITLEMMGEAMAQAKLGRAFIMGKMLETIQKPRAELSKYAPLILTIQIDPEKIRDVIGKGGETIQKITAECGVEIDIEQTGQVVVTAPDQVSGSKAVEWIKRLTYVPVAGEIFDGTITRIMDFGCFVEFLPGKEGLVHVSKLRPYRVENVSDEVKVGDKDKVKLTEIDDQGRNNLSMKEFYVDKNHLLPKGLTAPPGGISAEGTALYAQCCAYKAMTEPSETGALYMCKIMLCLTLQSQFPCISVPRDTISNHSSTAFLVLGAVALSLTPSGKVATSRIPNCNHCSRFKIISNSKRFASFFNTETSHFMHAQIHSCSL